MQKEIWIDFNENYSVSSNGRVFSKLKSKYLKFGNNGNGYLFVNLYFNKKPKAHYVHRLVAICFLENKSAKPQVNHKDCNKSNNNVSNLEWCYPSENINHAKDNKRFYTSDYQKLQTSKSNRGIKSHLSKLSENDVLEIKKQLKEKDKTQKEIAILFNTTRANIGAIKRNKSWKHINL